MPSLRCSVRHPAFGRRRTNNCAQTCGAWSSAIVMKAMIRLLLYASSWTGQLTTDTILVSLTPSKCHLAVADRAAVTSKVSVKYPARHPVQFICSLRSWRRAMIASAIKSKMRQHFARNGTCFSFYFYFWAHSWQPQAAHATVVP